jgi:hypothetical protein
MHVYEVRPRRDKRGVDLISDALPFGRLWYDGPNAVSNAIGYAQHRSRFGAGPLAKRSSKAARRLIKAAVVSKFAMNRSRAAQAAATFLIPSFREPRSAKRPIGFDV